VGRLKRKNISRGKLEGNKMVINCKGEKWKIKEKTSAREKQRQAILTE